MHCRHRLLLIKQQACSTVAKCRAAGTATLSVLSPIQIGEPEQGTIIHTRAFLNKEAIRHTSLRSERCCYSATTHQAPPCHLVTTSSGMMFEVPIRGSEWLTFSGQHRSRAHPSLTSFRTSSSDPSGYHIPCCELLCSCEKSNTFTLRLFNHFKPCPRSPCSVAAAQAP